MVTTENFNFTNFLLRQEIDVLGEEPRTSLPPQASQPLAKPTTKSFGSVLNDQGTQNGDRAKFSKTQLHKPTAPKPMISEAAVTAKVQISTIPLSTMKPLNPAPPKSVFAKGIHIAKRTVALTSDVVVLAVFIPVVGVMTAVSTLRRWIVRR